MYYNVYLYYFLFKYFFFYNFIGTYIFLHNVVISNIKKNCNEFFLLFIIFIFFSHAVSCIIHFTFLKISSFLSLIISLTVLYSSFTFYIIDFAYVFHCVLHIILSILLFLICCFCSTSLGCGFWMISWWRIRDDSVRIDSASTWAIHSLYIEKYINQRGEVILVQDKLQTL